MNSISLQPEVVVTLWGSGVCAFGLGLGPLGAVSGAICCWFGSAFGDGYFGLSLLPFCLAFWGCVELALYSLLPGGMEWPSGHFCSLFAYPHPPYIGGLGNGLASVLGVVDAVLARFSPGAEVARIGCFLGSSWACEGVCLGQARAGVGLWVRAGLTNYASLQSYHNLCCDSVTLLAS